jgi:hypothetical protein
MVTYFSQSKGEGLAKFYFFTHHFFLKGSFIAKKVDIALVGTFDLFFVGCLSTFLIISLLTSFSNFFAIIK